MLLDRIVRQGRAFGIHVCLDRKLWAARIHWLARPSGKWSFASHCNAMKPTLTSSWMKTIPRRGCSRGPAKESTTTWPGPWKETILFKRFGFPRVSELPYLRKVEALAEEKDKLSIPIVFEGNAPANFSENPLLRGLISMPASFGARNRSYLAWSTECNQRAD